MITPFSYDPFQQTAINHIKNNLSVIVSAPTGAGKTAIAEYIINDCLETGSKVIYTAPIKALSNQKFRDFQEIFPEKIGILTGDVTINSHAPILIMTTEIFRNKILDEKNNLDSYSWIIFDEVHYIDDYERGTVWEESLIFLPHHMKMLALSATIPNIEELALWIESIHKRPLKIVKENNRLVPLHFFYQVQDKLLDNLNEVNASAYRSQRYVYHRGKRYLKHRSIKPNRIDALFKHLDEKNRLPCIYFVFNRKRCETLASETMKFDFLSQEEKTQIIQLYNQLCERFGLTHEKSANYIFPLIEKGIAYHHAGMLPTLKEVIERLFTSKLIKVLFTTETFALGINMPARTVIFDELRKFYGKFFDNLKTRDFYQMAGRAGRRGIDKEGFVYSRVNPNYISYDDLCKIIYNSPEKITSRFNASYATMLNLYQNYNEKIYEIYPFSFHYFQQKTKNREKALDLLYAKVRILKELGCIKNNGLTEKGIFASKIYGYELSLSELYDAKILDNLSEIELGILCIALVFEPRKNSKVTPLTKFSRSLSNITDNIMTKIHKLENKYRIKPLSKTYSYHLSNCLELWMRKESFDNILQHTEEDEGGVIRYFRMSVQILREMLDTHGSKNFKGKIEKAISLINRDIIDAEKELRM